MSSTSFAHLSKQVLIEELIEKSIDEKEVLTVVEEEGSTWMTPIYEYLTKEILPEEKRKARAIHRKADRYNVTNETLYKRSFLEPWLRCVGPLQANYVLREIHEGSCNMHAGPRSMVAKALRSWNPQQKLTPITSPWLFYKWGIDIAGPFPEGPGKVKFLIVAIDYFTKWIKPKPVATITGAQCEKLCIRQCFASVKHPQANGLVERENRSLGKGIKSSNGETPFSLTYGTKAVFPVEIGMPTMRTAEVDMIKNYEALEINLDVLEEKREVRRTSFRLGDLVCRNNEASRAEDGSKLGPKWEGPYEVTEALGKGAYKLRDRNGNTLLRTWNVCSLKKCYVHEM
ncbi:reverse transcriptase domain-containing protein [Tanacetum coccineum]